MEDSPARLCILLSGRNLTVAIRPSFPFKQRGKALIDGGNRFGKLSQIDTLDPPHVGKRGELVEISADSLLLTEDFIESFDHKNLSAEAGFRDVLGEIQLGFRSLRVDFYQIGFGYSDG